MDNVLSAGHIEDVSGDILELGYCIRRPTTAPSSFLIGTMHGGTFGGKVCDEAKVPVWHYVCQISATYGWYSQVFKFFVRKVVFCPDLGLDMLVLWQSS